MHTPKIRESAGKLKNRNGITVLFDATLASVPLIKKIKKILIDPRLIQNSKTTISHDD